MTPLQYLHLHYWSPETTVRRAYSMDAPDGAGRILQGCLKREPTERLAFKAPENPSSTQDPHANQAVQGASRPCPSAGGL